MDLPHVVKYVAEKEGQYGIRVHKHSYLQFLDCVRKALEDIGGVPECMEYKIDTSRFRYSHKTNTTGIPNCTFYEGRGYLVQVRVSGKHSVIWQGPEENVARRVSAEIGELKKSGCLDPEEYRAIGRKYRRPTQRNNTSG